MAAAAVGTVVAAGTVVVGTAAVGTVEAGMGDGVAVVGMVAGGMEEAGAGEVLDIGEVVIILITGAAILIGVADGAGVVVGAAATGVEVGGAAGEADGMVAGTAAVAGTGVSQIDQRIYEVQRCFQAALRLRTRLVSRVVA
jgi:hypothetical protein